MEQSKSFQEYKLSKELKETLQALGYLELTKIQREVIPLVLEGYNVIGKSKTGSGKTAAFAIPLCEKVSWEENLPQVLVLEPTRELAVQVQDEFFQIGRKKRLKIPALFGGFPIEKQIQTLRQKSHIIVGTPGRIMDHARRETLKFTNISYLVIDEADLMLDMGFAEEVGDIIALLPEHLQILLFSATMNEKVEGLIKNHVKEAKMVIQEDTKEEENPIVQVLYETEQEEKYKVLKELLMQENPKSAMIFCGTKEMVNVLFQKLRRDRIFCGMIHGDLEQKERLKTVEAFRRGGFRYLIATDVAARGIDFEEIELVVNYDFPTGRETYVHRIGRTGRNGKEGRAISLICQEDKKMLHMVEEYIGYSLTLIKPSSSSEEEKKEFWETQRKKPERKKQKGDILNRTITRLTIGGGRKSKMRAVDIVGTICSIEGVEASDIGIIDVRDSLTSVEILNGKGKMVYEALLNKTIKGKLRKVQMRQH